MYRVHTSVNYADTCRDPDNIHVDELGYFKKLEKALDIANSYIKNRFFHKNTTLTKSLNGNYSATDFCSYGKTIYVTKIILK